MILIAKDMFVIFIDYYKWKSLQFITFNCVSLYCISVNSVLSSLLLAKIPNDEWNILQSNVKVMTKKFYFKRFFLLQVINSELDLSKLTMTFLRYTQSFVT